jgi:hypothetical protein
MCELIDFSTKHDISVVSIQEHRMYFETSSDDCLYRIIDSCLEWKFIYSSATECGNCGVAFLMKKVV